MTALAPEVDWDALLGGKVALILPNKEEHA